MLHRFFTGLHRRCSLFVHDLHSLFITRKFSVISGCVLIAIVILAGCGKPAAPSSESDSKAADASTNTLQAASEPLLKFHWIGKKQLATEANATNFMAIWNLPESARLEAQTLDKLATAPWRLWQTNVALSNAPSHLLRPLLDDLVQEEIYLEATGGSNQISELVIALRLPDDRATLWESNLPVVLNSLSNLNLALSPSAQSSAAHNWQLSLTRTGGWTFVSFARPATDSPLVGAFASRVAADGAPYAPRATNYWVELDAITQVFLSRTESEKLDILRTNPPQIELRILGESGNVRTRADLQFPSNIPLEMEPWNVPTNLVHDPISGFMAVRGFRPWLKAFGWNEAKFGDTPNQIYFWAQAGGAPLHFFAFPSTKPTDQIKRLSEFLLTEINPLMATSATVQNTPVGAFEKESDSFDLRWRGLPLLTPNLRLSREDGFITGGLFGNRITNRPAPTELLQQFKGDSNLIWYDWEISQFSTRRLIQATQVVRFIFGRSRLSMADDPGLPWLVAIAPKLGTAGTSIRQITPERLNVLRSSTVGLTAAELHFLVEWLESPDFPVGIFTLNSPPGPSASSKVKP